MATRETDKPLLLSAMLGSKNEVVIIMRLFPMTVFYLDIEVEGVDEDAKQSYFFVSLYVADIKVAKSKKSKPQSSVVKLDWKEHNQLWVVLWLSSGLGIITSLNQLFRTVVICENWTLSWIPVQQFSQGSCRKARRKSCRFAWKWWVVPMLLMDPFMLKMIH